MYSPGNNSDEWSTVRRCPSPSVQQLLVAVEVAVVAAAVERVAGVVVAVVAVVAPSSAVK